MKVLLINGSPRAKGNTYIALHEMEKIFAQECRAELPIFLMKNTIFTNG